MAVTYVSSTKDSYNSTAKDNHSFTVDIGTRTNGLLVVSIDVRANVAPTAVTFNGVSLDLAEGLGDANAPGHHSSIWYLVAPADGSHTLAITLASAVTTFAIFVAWCDGAWQSQADVLDDTNSGSAVSATPTVDVQPTVDSSIIFATLYSEGNNPPTSTDETVYQTQDFGVHVAGASYYEQSTAALRTMDFATQDDRYVIVGASFKPVPSGNARPTIALNTADATEFDTATPALEFTGSDAEDDDLEYNIQINSNPSFPADGSALADNYNSGGGLTIHPNPDAVASTWLGQIMVDDRPGQSFTALGGILDKISIYFQSDSATDGNAYIRVYAHEGTFGTTSAPLDAAAPEGTPTPGWLAISDALPCDTEMSSGFYDFTFSDENRIALIAGAKYVFIVDWVPTTREYANTIQIEADAITLGHAGNLYIDGGQPANNGPHDEWDMKFRVYEDPIVLDKVSTSDSGFANTVTGGDTHPFNAGEKIAFTVQAADALLDGMMYFWRARAVDPDPGSGDYSDWPTARSLTIALGVTSTKTINDVGAGAESIGGIAVSLSVSETGAGADTLPGTAVAASMDDVASGVDLAAVLASLNIPDSAVAQDALAQILAVLGISDVASAPDTVAEIIASLSLPDAGEGVDTLYQITTSLDVLDSGAGEDSVPGMSVSATIDDPIVGLDAIAQILSSLMIDDTIAGTDVAQSLTLIVIDDTGAVVDALVVAALVPVDDVIIGDEGLTFSVVLTVSDTVSAADAVEVFIESIMKMVDDIASGLDAPTISVSATITDAASGSEGCFLNVTLTVSDASLGDESIVTSVSFAVTDTVTASETFDILTAFLISIQDLASGLDEVAAVEASILITETAVGIDAISQLLSQVMITDFGQGTDVVIMYDSSTRIVTITATIAGRSISSTIAKRSISAEMSLKSIDGELNSED